MRRNTVAKTWKPQLECSYRKDRDERIVRIFELLAPETRRTIAAKRNGRTSDERRYRSVRSCLER